MQFLESLSAGEVDLSAILLKLGLAFLLGGLTGLERELSHQPAGLRTHILISTGACLLTVLSIFIGQGMEGTSSGDPGRIASQIVSGIGFLGAGAIINFGVDIRGLTTAASVWSTAAIGMAVGGGLFTAAAIATGIILFALIILEQLEKKILPDKNLKILTVECEGKTIIKEEIYSVLKDFKIKVRSLNIRQLIKENKTEYKMIIYINRETNLDEVYARFHSEIKNITRLEIVQEA
ncbi:MAG: MgtC/SapB family protein [Spirochaetia bacterium]